MFAAVEEETRVSIARFPLALGSTSWRERGEVFCSAWIRVHRGFIVTHVARRAVIIVVYILSRYGCTRHTDVMQMLSAEKKSPESTRSRVKRYSSWTLLVAHVLSHAPQKSAYICTKLTSSLPVRNLSSFSSLLFFFFVGTIVDEKRREKRHEERGERERVFDAL